MTTKISRDTPWDEEWVKLNPCLVRTWPEPCAAIQIRDRIGESGKFTRVGPKIFSGCGMTEIDVEDIKEWRYVNPWTGN